MAGRYRDLSPIWWLWLTLVPVTVLLALALFYMRGYYQLTYKEGPVEWLSVLIALVGVGMAIVAHVRRKVLPTAWLGVFPLLFILGFLFIAGEESSWGQHILNPRLPGQSEEVKNDGLANIDPREQHTLTSEQKQEVRSKLNWLQRHNDQSEDNLHNLPGILGDIFGKLPKQLIEFGSLIGCVIVPLFFARKLKLDDVNTVGYWFWPTKVCCAAALIAFLLPWPKRIVELFFHKAPTYLRLSETQELYLYIVLVLYIASLAVRLRQHQRTLAQRQVTPPVEAVPMPIG